MTVSYLIVTLLCGHVVMLSHCPILYRVPIDPSNEHVEDQAIAKVCTCVNNPLIQLDSRSNNVFRKVNNQIEG